jgi:hypothetical protein
MEREMERLHVNFDLFNNAVTLGCPKMTDTPLSALLQQVANDVASLPVTTVQLVGALVAMQHELPPALRDFIMSKLALRTDMSMVSPAAEAVMRISAFTRHRKMELAQIECQTQYAFLKAVALDDKVVVAVAFMAKLADRLETAVVVCSDATLMNCQPKSVLNTK